MTNSFEIHHVNVLVDDLADAVTFYREVLGLPMTATPDQGFPSQFFQFNDRQQLHMNQLSDSHGLRSHFCLVVDDFMGIYRRARDAKAIDLDVWGKIRRIPNGKLQMFVRDPSGNLIEIASQPGAKLDDEVFEAGHAVREVGNYVIHPQ